jgi:hypothetical protein
VSLVVEDVAGKTDELGVRRHLSLGKNRNVAVATLRPVPRARSIDPGRAVADALGPGGPHRIALVANGKPNSMELLDALVARLATRLDVGEVRRYRKPSVSVPPTDGDMAEIAEWAHAVLTAVGD